MTGIPIPPRLRTMHRPGFTMRYCARYPAWVLFETETLLFNMSFEIDLFEDGTVSASLQPGGQAELRPDTTDLTLMAEATDSLALWLEDCATALAWSRTNALTLLETLHNRKAAGYSGGQAT